MNRRLLFAALKVMVSALLLVFVVRAADWEDVAPLLQTLGSGHLMAAGICLALAVTLNAVRWNQVLSTLGENVPRRVTLVGTFEGMFFNLFLPTSVGGDAVKAYRVFDHGVVPPQAVGSVLIERALGLLAVGIFLLIAIGLSEPVATSSFDPLLILGGVIAVGGIGAAFLGRFIDPLRFPSWMRALAILAHSYGRVLISRRFLAGIMPVMIVANLLTASTMWLLASGIGFDLTFLEAMIVLQASTLVALVPISVGGWGIREGTSVYVLTAMGAGSTQAVAVSVLFGLALMFIGVIGAIAWISSPYRGKRHLSQLQAYMARRRQQHSDKII